MASSGRLSWVLALGLVACGSSDKKEPCPEGFVAGQTVACMCEDMSQGIHTCQPDGNLDDCACAPGGGAGGTTGATGATGGAGGTTNTSTGATGGVGGAGSGGAGGTGTEPADGGTMPDVDAGGGGGTGAVDLPMDGNQGAICVDGTDCNQGLDCYAAGPGQGYCTATCTTDDECTGLSGAEYTCSTNDQVCRVICQDENDTASCPENMVCVDTGGGGGGSFRCKYPEASATGAGEPWSSCASAMDCADGMACAGVALAGTGYCAAACMQNDECPAAPDSSSITATCVPSGFMGGGGGGVCALECFGAMDGCPDGMTCINSGFSYRCGYQ